MIEEATCTAVGTRERTCLDCGYAEKAKYGPVHDYEWEVVKEPTCDRYGTSKGVCKVCGRTTTVYPSALGHDYGERVKVAPTCTKDGYYISACSRCTRKNTRPSGEFATGHTSGEWVIEKEPTCQEFGKKSRYCTVCGAWLQTTSMFKTSCKYGEWTVTKEPTCTEEGEKQRACEYCGKTETETIDKTNHSYGDWVVTKEPTCLETGENQRTCKYCGKTDTKTINKSGHTFGRWEIIKDSTCLEDGYKRKVCAVCGEMYGDIEIVSAAGEHTFKEWVVTREPTCLEDGYKRKVCAVCGEKYDGEVIKAAGEHKTSQWIITVQPTCSSTGLRMKVCLVCGEKSTEIMNRLPHTRGNWVITEQPTCQTFGLKKEICTACGKTIGNYFTPRIDHDYSVRKILEEPTCTGEGSEVHACSMCGNSIDWNSIPALGHELTGATIIKKPTCTDDGIKNGICSRCNKKTNVIIPATGHKEAAEKDIQPTCTQDGLSGKKHCFVCGKILNNGTRIPKLGHAYTKWTVERHATNKHTGVRWRECTRCDYFDIDIIPMVQYDINDAWIKLSRTSYTADGKAKKPTVTIEYEYNRLKKNTDYTVKYSNNIAAGRAKVTITGKGGYNGTVVKYFKILPAKQKIKAVAPLANSFAVTWTKDSGVTGYQVMYGTKSDLSDGKSVDIISNTKGKKTVKGLKAKKTYYVKVRSYKNVGNSKYYGAWSDVKKVKTK